MSNDTPPHACLADFSFITAVYEPDGISCSIAVGIESISFVAPELLSGCEKPTPQADVYAVGVAIIEVREQDYGCRLFLCTPSPRSSRVNTYSTVIRTWCFYTTYCAASSRINRRTPRPSDFLTHCGI